MSIARFLYVYVNKNPNEDLDPVPGEFIRFVYSRQGQEAVVRDGYFPVTKALADQDLGVFGGRSFETLASLAPQDEAFQCFTSP